MKGEETGQLEQVGGCLCGRWLGRLRKDGEPWTGGYARWRWWLTGLVSEWTVGDGAGGWCRGK